MIGEERVQERQGRMGYREAGRAREAGGKEGRREVIGEERVQEKSRGRWASGGQEGVQEG